MSPVDIFFILFFGAVFWGLFAILTAMAKFPTYPGDDVMAGMLVVWPVYAIYYLFKGLVYIPKGLLYTGRTAAKGPVVLAKNSKKALDPLLRGE